MSLCQAKYARHNTVTQCVLSLGHDIKIPHQDDEGNTWRKDDATDLYCHADRCNRTHLEGEPCVVRLEDGHEAQVKFSGLARALAREWIDHPSHYGGDIEHEHIKCVTSWGLGYRLGQATKYICRMGKKDLSDEKKIEDLQKAIWYIQSKIDLIKTGKDRVEN